MDPLNIHHVIRHRLSRMETNDFQDKSGCSINGFRSFLFEEGIVEDLDDMERLVYNHDLIQDYRGCPISLVFRNFKNFQLSDEILRMKNVQFYFQDQAKPIHKLVSPEPHFVEEDRNLIENHFKYMAEIYGTEDIEEWSCFQMDCEGNLLSVNSNFQTTNKSIEHLSNFPHLRELGFRLSSSNISGFVTNFSLLSNLRRLSMSFGDQLEDPEMLKDLGLFTNLRSMSAHNFYGGFSRYSC